MPQKIYLYDSDWETIGIGSLSSSSIQYQLAYANGDDIDVHISSIGGDAFDAITTYNLLKQYQGTVNTYVDSLAASAASIIAMAGKTVFMNKYAMLMVHKPSMGASGNADDLSRSIDILDKFQKNLAQIYIDKTGLSEIEINNLVNNETWMDAEVALSLGFVDEVLTYDDNGVKNSATIQKSINKVPQVYQRVINKILNNASTTTTMENKELIEKNNSLLSKILNIFKVQNATTDTDKGVIHHTGGLKEGSKVFNDEDMEDSTKDGVYECTKDKSKVTVKDGMVSSIEKSEDDDDDSNEGFDSDDEDLENSTVEVLNSFGFKITNKVKVKDFGKISAEKLTELNNKVGNLKTKIANKDTQISEQAAIIQELQNSLAESNKKLSENEETIRKKITSDYTPTNSQRSTKTKVNNNANSLPDFLKPKENSTADRMAKMATEAQEA